MSTPIGMNEKVGLPRGEGMQKVAICFDVDGTLMGEGELWLPDTIGLLQQFMIQPWKNAKVVVWSGGGAEYAERMTRRMLPTGDVNAVTFMSKLDHQKLRDAGYLILAVDDIQDTRLGDINLIVRNK